METQRAEVWRRGGGRFRWRPADGGASAVEVFHVEMGDPEAPALLLVHGWPTSSIDWCGAADQLSAEFRVCALDFPGYGFSDKPRDWDYSLGRDEELVEFYLAEVIGAESAVIVSHDRGDSVALLHAARCVEGRSAVRLEHLVLSNGNIFLPMSSLTGAQRTLLDPATGPAVAAALTPAQLAEAMGASTMTPPRQPGDPDVEALTATFAHQDGPKVLHQTIQYLVERAEHEQSWLDTLVAAPFPATLIWGLCDTVSPPRVASYVWHNHLMLRRGGGRLYFVPDANHYLQVDRPDAFVAALRHALAPSVQAPGVIGPEPHSPLLVDCSRERLSAAADLLRQEAPATAG